MCLAAAVLMLMRTPMLPLTMLGDVLHSYFPDIPTSDTYGKVGVQLVNLSVDQVDYCSLRSSSFFSGVDADLSVGASHSTSRMAKWQ